MGLSMAKKDTEPTWTPRIVRGSCLKRRKETTSDGKLFIVVCTQQLGHLGGCD